MLNQKGRGNGDITYMLIKNLKYHTVFSSITIGIVLGLAVYSSSPIHASIRVFSFFTSMLCTYYIFTILFLGFFPKSQIVLWALISLISPICGAIIWYAHENIWLANFLVALPIVTLSTEWYITGRDNILLFVIYLCMIIFLFLHVPKNLKQCPSIILIITVMDLLLLKTGWMDFIIFLV